MMDTSPGRTLPTVYDFTATAIDLTPIPLSQYRGEVLLIVNVASRCGFTPQYAGLERLQRAYHDQGFNVLGFPCNQFGQQEPGSEAEIRKFCSSHYEVTFPLFSHIRVNGPEAHPLYRFLKQERPGLLGTEAIKWNFTKFLVGRDGRPLKRFGPNDTPEQIEPTIRRLL
ncbi:MAG TPA: glutathione peroxidase [Gemmatimonadales bacterium]|nr:glutathione peroxidase [Gemmatimonadales bacterium]